MREDKIAPEVVTAGLQVLEALEKRSGEFEIHSDVFDWGSDDDKKHGILTPDAVYRAIAGSNILKMAAAE